MDDAIIIGEDNQVLINMAFTVEPSEHKGWWVATAQGYRPGSQTIARSPRQAVLLAQCHMLQMLAAQLERKALETP